MNKSELTDILRDKNITPGKKFGQNFMIDNNLLDYIVSEADITSEDIIVEIGPGCGALTRKILEKTSKLIAVEIDKRLVEYLKENIETPGFTLIQGDACRVDIPEILENYQHGKNSTGNWKCIANLPYSVSSPFIAETIESRNPPSEMLFLLQKETAMRLAASSGTKNYGALSVRVQSVFNVKMLRKIPPDVFYPKPEIDSALVKFIRKENYPDADEIKKLSKIVKTVFMQRRKKMIKSLAPFYEKEQAFKIFENMNISTNTRPEELTPQEFLTLIRS